MTTLGERIRELRDAKDFSLRELARILDVSAAFLSDVELGRRYPSEELLAKIAKKLGTTLKELDAYDPRPPLGDLKRLASANPAYGFALRRMVDENVSAEELLRFVERQRTGEGNEEEK
jgi:transcriptional regulator with XRE-family HTH domain